MSAVHKVDVAGSLVDITSRILREGWQVKEQAEEGATPMVAMAIADPVMDFEVNGHREYLILEDDSESTDDVLYHGYTGAQDLSRGFDTETGDPLGRAWYVELMDTNALWARRVMEGLDCKRSAETDVERMQWLLSTSEAAEFDDVTTFVYTSDPVNMDAVDYRGQMFSNIADDCAQESGKNWFVGYRKNGASRETFVWYGNETEAGYVSPLKLSNDPTDWTDAELEDGTSLVWPISDDTKLRRDPSRVFSGAHVPYDGGSTYVKKDSTAEAFARRDSVMPSVNVKTKAGARRRGRRYLNDLDEQDLTITTKVTVPKGKATKLRAGMAVDFKGTHMTDGLDEFTTCRILEAAPKPVDAGERYEIDLKLQVPKGTVAEAPTGAILYMLHGMYNGDYIYFEQPGDTPPAGFPARVTASTLIPLVDPAPPNDRWAYYGWTVDGTGTIDLYLNAPAAGVLLGGTTIFTWSIRKNGVVVGSYSTSHTVAGLTYWDEAGIITVTGLSVAPGDEITAHLTASQAVAFFSVRGIGDLNQRFEVTGGTLV